MPNMQSEGSGPIRKALVFALGLVLVLSVAVVIIMDRRVSGLEALEARVGAIEGKLERMQEQLDYIEANVHPPSNR